MRCTQPDETWCRFSNNGDCLPGRDGSNPPSRKTDGSGDSNRQSDRGSRNRDFQNNTSVSESADNIIGDAGATEVEVAGLSSNVGQVSGDLQGVVESKKFDFLFGRATGSQHNIDRSKQFSMIMKGLGIFEDTDGIK
ncbi:hypothetical protein [Baaleninema simplex]|uniref:hypothetical protein n=1 Tax=Baaleninema simplex TaxID=2862350 RepID=UPI001181B22D|nr:hypothetical protein [Baaleninema simplex]